MRESLKRLFRVQIAPVGGAAVKQPRRLSWKRRFKMMMRHTRLIAVAAVLLCAGLGTVAYYFLTLPVHLRIAVGPLNSDDHKVIQAITAHLARDRASIRLRPMLSEGGTREAAAALDAGKADLAVVRRDIRMPAEGQVVAIFRRNVAVFIVPEPEAARAPARSTRRGGAARNPAPKKIQKIEDLVGRRLAIIGRSDANFDLLRSILRQYNMGDDKIALLDAGAEAKLNAPDKINIIRLNVNSVGSEIRERKPDAILSVGPVSSAITANAIAAATRDREPPTFLEIGAAEALAERNPVYEATEIKAGAFGGSPPRPEDSIETVGVNHYIVAHRKVSEDTIAQFTRLLFVMRPTLATEAPTAAKIEAPDTDKDALVQVHPGAAAYVDGEMKSFFDRYNDLLFWGLMLMSFVGSAMASVVSYTKSDDRSRRLKALEKLLEVTKDARVADTIQKLDELQHETDRIMAGMIRDVEGNALDEVALTAFSISLDQAQLALSDRRAALLGQPMRARPVVAAL